VTKSDTLSTALVAAFAEIEGAAKDKVNPHFKSKYADLASVIDAVKIPLTKYGLAFEQHMSPSESGVIIETVVRHTSGETASFGSLYVPANKNDAQGFGSALTYARRYALMTAFGVPAEDDDGNAAVASTRAANANPKTGETPPAKRVPLSGPYTSKTQLWAAVRAFVHAGNGMADLGEWIAYRDSRDSQELLEQCKRDAPALWSEGLPDVPEYVPLEIFIADKTRELEQLEDIHRANPILAG
jgi:hypothetical protein